jgi:hypothetical protein
MCMPNLKENVNDFCEMSGYVPQQHEDGTLLGHACSLVDKWVA